MGKEEKVHWQRREMDKIIIRKFCMINEKRNRNELTNTPIV